MGDYYHDLYSNGNRDIIALLTAEEDNLLQARTLARRYGWHRVVIGAMQGLNILYDHTGRRGKWASLVQETIRDFVNPNTDKPQPGIEGEDWNLALYWQARLAEEARKWSEVEKIRQQQVDYWREQSAVALTYPPESLTPLQHNQIRSLGVSLHQLGNTQRERGEITCVASYQEVLPLLDRIGDSASAAVVAFTLGHVYKDLPTLRDLDKAESWYRRSLDLTPATDYLGQSGCYAQLGAVAYERFQEARQSGADKTTRLSHLNAALTVYQQALTLLPAHAVNDLAMTHKQLGVIYKNIGDLPHALSHYQESIVLAEHADNLYEAGTTRRNMALALQQAGRLGDALLYVQAALHNFQPYGAGAQTDIDNTQRLITAIQQAMAAGS